MTRSDRWAQLWYWYTCTPGPGLPTHLPLLAGLSEENENNYYTREMVQVHPKRDSASESRERSALVVRCEARPFSSSCHDTLWRHHPWLPLPALFWKEWPSFFIYISSSKLRIKLQTSLIYWNCILGHPQRLPRHPIHGPFPLFLFCAISWSRLTRLS
jgi:hypothetical protein